MRPLDDGKPDPVTRGAMKQRILGSHTPPCHGHMVITTQFSVLPCCTAAQTSSVPLQVAFVRRGGGGGGRTGGEPPTSTAGPSGPLYTRMIRPTTPALRSRLAAPRTSPRADADIHPSHSRPAKWEGRPPGLAGLALAGPTMKQPLGSPPDSPLLSSVSTSESTRMGPSALPVLRTSPPTPPTPATAAPNYIAAATAMAPGASSRAG